jgi:hypothetical protein
MSNTGPRHGQRWLAESAVNAPSESNNQAWNENDRVASQLDEGANKNVLAQIGVDGGGALTAGRKTKYSPTITRTA